MKNTFLKIIGKGALAILMLAVFAQIRVSAQQISVEGQPPEGLTNNKMARDLEGSWDVQVTARNCQTGEAIKTFLAMITYMRGGTMQEFGTGSGLLRGPGHGVWSYQSGQYFSSNFQFFRFNPNGTLAQKQINRRQIVLRGSQIELSGLVVKNSYTASSTVEIYNPDGVLIATGCATEEATRFK